MTDWILFALWVALAAGVLWEDRPPVARLRHAATSAARRGLEAWLAARRDALTRPAALTGTQAPDPGLSVATPASLRPARPPVDPGEPHAVRRCYGSGGYPFPGPRVDGKAACGVCGGLVDVEGWPAALADHLPPGDEADAGDLEAAA